MNLRIMRSLTAAAVVSSAACLPLAAPAQPATDVAVVQTHTTENVSRQRNETPKHFWSSDSENERAFHPDYSHALSVQQMTAAWNAEIDRVFMTAVIGGG